MMRSRHSDGSTIDTRQRRGGYACEMCTKPILRGGKLCGCGHFFCDRCFEYHKTEVDRLKRLKE